MLRGEYYLIQTSHAKTDTTASEHAPLLDGSTAGELIPEIVRHGLQQLIKLKLPPCSVPKATSAVRTISATRNGYRPGSLATQVGDIDLMIPELRSGSSVPSILEPRRRVDQALYGVVMEAYVSGISLPQGRCPSRGSGRAERHFQIQGGVS